MATQQNRKGPGADGPQAHGPRKKPRVRRPFHPSPAFWDNLSKVPLTPGALREIDRRNKPRPVLKPPVPAAHAKDLGRFARRGGPDLHHFRGYRKPSDRMSSSYSPTEPGGGGKTSAYGREFEIHLADHNIYVRGRKSKPKNIKEDSARLSQLRASLSPSRFGESDFEDFQERDDDDTVSENDVMATIIPILCRNANIPSKQNILFTELAPLTSSYKDVVRPKPDFFDGARIGDLNREVRNPKGYIYPLIIPTKYTAGPVVPNFFLEVKGPSGAADVLKRQVCYNGAYGARAMHALQNYGKEEPTYDGNAYTYSSSYIAGTLKLYAHHITAPTNPGGRPEYHMTQVGGYALASNFEACVAGIRAFRNARDLAQHYRDTFIQEANARARRSAALAVDEPEAADVEQDGGSDSDEAMDSGP
ncbi:hypothetical protein OQA88_7355 [Cercophora sp. LCS_1]